MSFEKCVLDFMALIVSLIAITLTSATKADWDLKFHDLFMASSSCAENYVRK